MKSETFIKPPIISQYNTANKELRMHIAVFFIINPTRCINFTNLFWHETLHVLDSSSVRQEFFHCALINGICDTGLQTALESCLQTCITYTIAECTRKKNSWRWTEELSETCRVSCQNKFVKLVHLVGFIIKKCVTMHGHMNAYRCISAKPKYSVFRIYLMWMPDSLSI